MLIANRNIDVKNMIYEIRGKQVMIDSDLAILYGCKNGTKEINQAVKNNPDKFPERYCFSLTNSENNYLRSKFLTANNKRRSNSTVFTEQGIYMLATILKTKEATKATINIMDAFVNMRKFIKENNDIFKRMLTFENKTEYIENSLMEQKLRIDELFDKFDRKEDLKNKLFFEGQIYDAFSLIVDVIGKAKKHIIVIDNYVNKVTLDMLSKKNKNVIALIITNKNKSKLTNIDIEKFNSEYSRLDIKYMSNFHDRFIIVDKKELYHLGASLKDLGNKVFGISKISDEEYLKMLLRKIKTE